jgi:hypothetical protein
VFPDERLPVTAGTWNNWLDGTRLVYEQDPPPFRMMKAVELTDPGERFAGIAAP